MDSDQVLKRVQWMEEERRKDKDAIALLENRVLSLEGSLNAANQQIKELTSELNRLAALTARMDQYDSTLLQLRIEAKRAVDELDKEVKKREEEAEKVRRVEAKAFDNAFAEVKKEIEAISRLEKGLQARNDDALQLRRQLEETNARIELLRRDEEEYTRTYRLLEDGRRQDAKRLSDLQGEVASLRKQSDTLRGQAEILSTAQRKLETRLNELSSVEAERRDAMTNFLDKQALTQVERDRVWKEWQTRFETIEKQAAEIEAQLLALDTTHRETKRIQAVLEELSQRVERRLNEVTEIQRLSEDRFRQEWVTFKADDQKRWTNYTLIQEEQRSELRRQFDRMNEQLAQLEDSQQEVQSLLQQVNELTEKRLQMLLSSAHEWVAAFERTVSRNR